MKNKKLTRWENIPSDITQYKGFIYLITNLKTGKKYVGKKFYWNKRRIKVKGRKNRKIKIYESDWKSYKSSSKSLQDDIIKYGEDNFKFEIIESFKSEKRLTFEETKYQFNNNILSSKLNETEYEYYNDNILGKFFRKDTIL